MLYAALILQKAVTADSSNPPLYEETVMLVEAATPSEAISRAETIASARQPRYSNPAGQLVTWSLERVVDVAPVIDALGDGAEIYSRHFRNFDDYVKFEPLMQRETESH